MSKRVTIKALKLPSSYFLIKNKKTIILVLRSEDFSTIFRIFTEKIIFVLFYSEKRTKGKNEVFLGLCGTNAFKPCLFTSNNNYTNVMFSVGICAKRE